MSHAARRRPAVPIDLDHVLAAVTFTAALLGVVLLSAGATDVGTKTGLVGVASGLWGQMMSRTRTERFFDVVGLGLAAVVLMVGASKGGLVS